MTQEQKVRTRDEQVVIMDQFIRTEPSGPHLAGWIGAQLREAEARGAAEERAKCAEGQEPVGYRHVLSNETDPGESVVLSETQDSPWGTLGQWDSAKHTFSPLYSRPVNIAALEVQVKELEGISDHACRCMSDSIEGLKAIEKGHVVQIWLRDEIEKIRAALKREGGV